MKARRTAPMPKRGHSSGSDSTRRRALPPVPKLSFSPSLMVGTVVAMLMSPLAYAKLLMSITEPFGTIRDGSFVSST